MQKRRRDEARCTRFYADHGAAVPIQEALVPVLRCTTIYRSVLRHMNFGRAIGGVPKGRCKLATKRSIEVVQNLKLKATGVRLSALI